MTFRNILDKPSLPDDFQRISLENLLIQSGLITAGDPFSLPPVSLNIELIPGKYKVDLIYKNCNEWGYRVALAILIINHQMVVEWNSLENVYGLDHIFVGSGLACFSDLETALRFNGLLEKWRESDPPKNYYDLVLKNEIQKRVLPGDRINSFCMHFPFDLDENIAIFESGMGDGSYGIYYGVGGNNDLSAIAIDFDILNWV